MSLEEKEVESGKEELADISGDGERDFVGSKGDSWHTYDWIIESFRKVTPSCVSMDICNLGVVIWGLLYS